MAKVWHKSCSMVHVRRPRLKVASAIISCASGLERPTLRSERINRNDSNLSSWRKQTHARPGQRDHTCGEEMQDRGCRRCATSMLASNHSLSPCPSSYVITKLVVGGRLERCGGFCVRGFDSAKSIISCSDPAEQSSMLTSFPLICITMVSSADLGGGFGVRRLRSGKRAR